jgi:hypothetical protein
MQPFGEWSIEETLFAHLVFQTPKGGTILELGSGEVSGVLSKLFTVYSVEHDKIYLGKYPTNYIFAPIVDDWYDFEIIKAMMPKYDTLLIDGPDAFVRPNFLKHTGIFDLSKPIFIDDTQEGYIKEFATTLSVKAGRTPVWVDGCVKKWCLI